MVSGSPPTESLDALLFEPYGTLIDIETDERDWYTYLHLSRFLEYRDIRISADELKWRWFELLEQQLAGSTERFPEVDVRAAWRAIIGAPDGDCTEGRGIGDTSFVTDVVMLQRALTRRLLRPLDGALETLAALATRVKIGIVSDSQPDYILPELRITGIDQFVSTTVVSGSRGYRKPDPRLFLEALAALRVPAERALFIGVDTGRDVAGARAAGIHSALLLTPYGSKDIALGEPDLVVDHLADLPGALAPFLL